MASWRASDAVRLSVTLRDGRTYSESIGACPSLAQRRDAAGAYGPTSRAARASGSVFRCSLRLRPSYWARLKSRPCSASP